MEVMDCTCDKEKMAATVKAAVLWIGGFKYDVDFNPLYKEDKFGWRSQIPGECGICYQDYLLEHQMMLDQIDTDDIGV